MKIKKIFEDFFRARKFSTLENVIPVPPQEGNSAELIKTTDCVNFDGSFDKLAEQVASLIKHYDAMATKMSDDNMKALLADMSNHLINSLILGGCDPIADDTEFDINRHMPIPFSIVEQGTPIRSVARIGVKLRNKVLVPSIVIIY